MGTSPDGRPGQSRWNAYIQAVLARGVKDYAVRWYVVRVERYILATSPKAPRTHAAGDLGAYLETVGRSGHLEGWQFGQLVHALEILFCDVVKASWVGGFDWQHWHSSARELEATHPTVARANTPVEMPSSRAEANSPPAVSDDSQKPPVLVRLITEIRRRAYSIRTEQAYAQWVERFIRHFDGRSPEAMGEAEIVSFLEYLAVQRNVAVSTQNQALSALLFLYKEVLKNPLEHLGNFTRPRRAPRLPVVLTSNEARALLAALDGVTGADGATALRDGDAAHGVHSSARAGFGL